MRSLERARTTKAVGRAAGIGLVLVCLLVPLCAMAQQQPLSGAPDVPNVVNPNENDFQRATHFLTFIGSFKPESATTARAYYKAIDPYNTKATFQQWLVNAGFIGQESDWRPSGPQIITSEPGCSGTHTCTYGPNKISTDAHVIVLNAADLGFVRNQFIRCVPSCSATNPKIYTYLENYPVAPFANTQNGSGGTSGFPFNSGYPTPAEATAAIKSAITRPLGTVDHKPDCLKATNPNAVRDCVERIADVAFEWAPPPTNLNSSTRFGQLYSFIFVHEGADSNGNPITVETTDFPPVDDFGNQLNGAQIILNFAAGDGSKVPIVVSPPNTMPPLVTDKFAPNLDGVSFGNKQHPGLCLVCHGGAPATLTSTGAYPRGGNINGFRFLPLDVRNLLFPSTVFPQGDFTLAGQQAAIKQYNMEVLLTVPTYAQDDGTGSTRVAALRTAITGWYSVGGNYSDDTSMASPTQNSTWIPPGWRDNTHGGNAPVGSEDVYLSVVGPFCRSCHFNREISLDFGTYANFHQESDLQQLALIAACKQNNPDPPDPGARFMPLALLTFVRFWQTQNGTQTLSEGPSLFHEVDRLAQDFGYSSVAGYCATNP